MKTRGRVLLAMLLTCACMAAGCVSHAADTKPAAEMHGASDAFAGPGIALAWGILRGKDETATEVVVRLDADPGTYASVAVTGVDPFTKASQPLTPLTRTPGTIEVRLPRSRFADLPRTEWRLYKSANPAVGEAPALLVYYQGIPDTTPEFNDEAKLREDLSRRIERARRAAKGKP
jgi:hypothetical protein